MTSKYAWRFVAPLGPIEKDDLRWYLEKYAIWPSEYFKDRARKVEESLVTWGGFLYAAAMPPDATTNVLQAWAQIDSHASRRFSVSVDATPEKGAPADVVDGAREAATLLLGLPWELLHDGERFLFQGAKPVLVRRYIPNTRVLDVPVVATPIRILLITARPEDDACLYLDHRASALPLVHAMESLGGLVELHVLDPPTLPALREELDRARELRRPYHVVHFDGHGVYNPKVGLGGLCFEDPNDLGKLEERAHKTETTEALGPLLTDHRIPLVFLEACQTAKAEQASESVASELLKVGVASVVAMSHSVLVETARRFVETFYGALAAGKRVGDAMLAGQRALEGDRVRGRIFGLGELLLDDWFVPVLYQEEDDPQLFRATPSPQTQEDTRKLLTARLGAVPAEPETGFVGRSRKLLALQRLFRRKGNGGYAVLRGQGGEGKTALAAEFARWMVRSQQIRRAAFVSVEEHSDVKAVLDAIGRQLVPKYSVATLPDLEEAIQPVERALAEESTILVVDNMESILQPPYVETPQALSEEGREELDDILRLCKRLNEKGETRLLFTSREALPAPFDGERQRQELDRLNRDDAVKLVERSLDRDAEGAGAASDATVEAIGELVDAVHGHARTLALLAPSLRSRGVDATRESLVELMAEMEQEFPGNRELSLFASVELSLRRVSPENRERAQVLGVFHGGVHLDLLRKMMSWEDTDVVSFATALVETGLATRDPYNHLTLNPALSPYLRGRMATIERDALATRWTEEMGRYVGYLYGEQARDAQMAATLTLLELPNLFALLEQSVSGGHAEATIDLASSLFTLLQNLGKPRLLERVAQARNAATAAMGDSWSHARFQSQRTVIEEQLDGGHVRAALEGAQALLQRARATGHEAYPEADYDLAGACFFLGRMLRAAGRPEAALQPLEEAQQRFEAIHHESTNLAAARMAALCITERGDCLSDLGRLDEAAAAYNEGIRSAEERGDRRGVAVGKFHLGSARRRQHSYADALEAFHDAREQFANLDEPRSVAGAWHLIGMACQDAGQSEAAEDAYRSALAIEVRIGDIAGQASTLHQLGSLYADLGRYEDAAAFFRQAAEKNASLGNEDGESRARNNLAVMLRRLRRLDEARDEILATIRQKERFGHATEPWKSWDSLSEIESDTGNTPAAAEAKRKARDLYLAYRRDGGENHDGPGRLAFDLMQILLHGDPSAAASLLDGLAADPEMAGMLPYIGRLKTIVAGNRDRSLAEAPELSSYMSAEILILIETLEAHEKASGTP